MTIEYRLDQPLTCGVGNATVFLLREDDDGDDSGVYGVGRNRRERHESIIRRRWCIGVRTCDRISVLCDRMSADEHQATDQLLDLLVFHSKFTDRLQVFSTNLGILTQSLAQSGIGIQPA